MRHNLDAGRTVALTIHLRPDDMEVLKAASAAQGRYVNTIAYEAMCKGLGLRYVDNKRKSVDNMGKTWGKPVDNTP